jgi:hypothetical protein
VINQQFEITIAPGPDPLVPFVDFTISANELFNDGDTLLINSTVTLSNVAATFVFSELVSSSILINVTTTEVNPRYSFAAILSKNGSNLTGHIILTEDSAIQSTEILSINLAGYNHGIDHTFRITLSDVPEDAKVETLVVVKQKLRT